MWLSIEGTCLELFIFMMRNMRAKTEGDDIVNFSNTRGQQFNRTIISSVCRGVFMRATVSVYLMWVSLKYCTLNRHPLEILLSKYIIVSILFPPPEVCKLFLSAIHALLFCVPISFNHYLGRNGPAERPVTAIERAESFVFFAASFRINEKYSFIDTSPNVLVHPNWMEIDDSNEWAELQQSLLANDEKGIN